MQRFQPSAIRSTWVAACLAASLVSPLAAAAPIDDAVATYQRGDLRAAGEAFARLAASGVPAAEYNLAMMHLRRELRGANDKAALAHLHRAADAGFVTAMVALAELHERGEAGLPSSLPQSVQWLRRAAEAGSADAQLALGTAHFLGRGTSKDPAQAAHWFRVAAQSGDAAAMYLYASMVEHGDGLPRDLAEARYWYAAAARGGELGAAEKARELDEKLRRVTY